MVTNIKNSNKIDKYSFYRGKRKDENDDLETLDHLHLPGTLDHLHLPGTLDRLHLPGTLHHIHEQSGLELHLPGTSAHLGGLVRVEVGLVREVVGLV